MKPFAVDVREAAGMQNRPGVVFLDVREPPEHAAASIEGAIPIPMRDVPQRLGELDGKAEIVVFCHHGSRSAMVVNFLRGKGFEKAVNMAGGIDAWSVDVDPSVPRYR